MPIYTEFYKSDQPDQPATMPNGWGWWHVGCFSEAYELEQPDGPLLSSLTEYTYQQSHTYTDPTDGEVLTITPEDRFRWWRG